jgi:hypothetical protein
MELAPRSCSYPEVLGEHSCLLDLPLRDDSFDARLSFYKSCYSASWLLRTEHDFSVPFTLIAKLLGVDQRTIRSHAKKYVADFNDTESPRRLSALPQDKVDNINTTILRFFEGRKSLMLAEIRSILTEEFERMITVNNLRAVLCRDPRLKTV